jgi:hypothetical protein
VTEELLLEKIKQDARREFIWIPEKDVEIRAIKRLKDCKFNDLKNRAEVEKWSNKIQDDNLGIFCASTKRDSIEMWDKFGNLHEGYCVGLIPAEIIKNPRLFGTIGKVDYYPSHKPPEIIPINLTEKDAIKNMTIKNFSVPDNFVYESEYRIAKYNYIQNKLTGRFERIKFNQDSRRVPIPESCYKEILLGSDISDKDRYEIIETCKNTMPNVPIYQAKFDENLKLLFFELL